MPCTNCNHATHVITLLPWKLQYLIFTYFESVAVVDAGCWKLDWLMMMTDPPEEEKYFNSEIVKLFYYKVLVTLTRTQYKSSNWLVIRSRSVIRKHSVKVSGVWIMQQITILEFMQLIVSGWSCEKWFVDNMSEWSTAVLVKQEGEYSGWLVDGKQSPDIVPGVIMVLEDTETTLTRRLAEWGEPSTVGIMCWSEPGEAGAGMESMGSVEPDMRRESGEERE